MTRDSDDLELLPPEEPQKESREKEKDEREVGAFWKRQSQSGTDYWTGTVLGKKVVMFANTKQRETQPDFRVLLQRER